MFNIRDFLKKAANKQAKEVLFREAVQQSVKKIAGADVSLSNISLKSTTVYLKGISPTARSAILVKKNDILEHIRNIQEIYMVKDLR